MEEIDGDEEVEADDGEVAYDSEWLRWWRIGRARQESEELWRRVWRELDERDRDNFGDALDFHGELLWNVEDLGDEFVRGWDIVVEELGDLKIYGVLRMLLVGQKTIIKRYMAFGHQKGN